MCIGIKDDPVGFVCADDMITFQQIRFVRKPSLRDTDVWSIKYTQKDFDCLFAPTSRHNTMLFIIIV